MRGPQAARRPRPRSAHPSLTWCQFCMERLILGTEPGCNLFMSLGWGRKQEPPLTQGNLTDPRPILTLVTLLGNLAHSFWASVSPLAMSWPLTKQGYRRVTRMGVGSIIQNP